MPDASPEKSVLELSRADSWIGEMLEIDLPRDPEGPAAADLAGDCFWASFQHEPTLSRDPPTERLINHHLLEWLMGQQSWEEAHGHTQGHIPASLKAAPALWSNLLTDEVVREALEAQRRADDAARRAFEAEVEASAQDYAASGAEALGQSTAAAQARAQAQELRDRAAEARAQGEARVRRALSEIRSWQEVDPQRAQAAAAAAIREAGREAREEAQVFAGWGYGPGQLARMPTDQVRQMAARLDVEKVRQIARQAGRYRGIATSARRSRVSSGPVPHGIALVHDLQDVLPEELAHLSFEAPAELRAAKAAQWVADGLPGIVRRGTAREEGDVVVGVDVSGSMQAGRREINAKAIALGVALMALKRSRRRFSLFSFSSGRDPVIRVTSDEVRRDPATLFAWAEATLRGGTSFDVPLREAMDWIADRPGADCILLSDGEARPSPAVAQEWRDCARRTGARLFYIAVAAGYGEIEALADQVLAVDDLVGEEADAAAWRLGRWMR